MMPSSSRDTVIDMIKGTCVALIVLGHSGFPYAHFIYLFHVAVFFIASGYLFNDFYSESLAGYKTFLRKRFCSLYLPCVGWNLAFLLFHNCLYELHLLGSPLPGSGGHSGGFTAWLPPVFSSEFWSLFFAIVTRFASGQDLVSVSWFFRAMLIAVLAFAAIDYVVRKVLPRQRFLIDSIICLGFLTFSFVYPPRGFSPALSSMIFLPMGMLLRRHPLPSTRPWAWAAALGGGAGLLVLSPLGSVELSYNYFTNPLFLIISSLAGWVFLWGGMTLLSRYPHVRAWPVLLGRRSIPILFLHLLCFKAATFLMILWEGAPWNALLRYPFGSASWWPASFAAGIILPLLLLKVWDCLKPLVRLPRRFFKFDAHRSVS